MTHRLRQLLCLLLLSTAALAQSGPNTRVTLVPEQFAVTPGSTVLVGIHFQLEPGWHIYWQNPGDSGEPLKAEWRFPYGYSAGPIEWPAPERMTNIAGVDYGYENEVTLLTRLKVPESARTGATFLTATLRWLICKNMCMEQKNEASLTVHVGDKVIPAEPAVSQLFAAAKAKLPKSLPAEWKANAMSNSPQLLLNFRPGMKVNDAEFFPVDKQVIENAAPQKLSSTSTRAQLSLKKDLTGPKPARLKGVLVLNKTDAYNVDLPLSGK